MKPLMILGALLGFLVAILFGFTGRSSWPTALWRASVAALAAALLTRWWTHVWIQGLQESVIQRRNARPPLPAVKPSSKS